MITIVYIINIVMVIIMSMMMAVMVKMIIIVVFSRLVQCDAMFCDIVIGKMMM
jgi:hypothetical protein